MGVQTYTLIQEQTLTSPAASVTFSSIPQIYEDLVLEMTVSGSAGYGWIRVNGDTASNYSDTRLQGNGTTASSNRNASNTAWYFEYGTTTSVLGLEVFQFQSYANTSINKTALSSNANSAYSVSASVHLWRSTAAITSIVPYTGSGNFDAGSTFRLFGLVA